VIVRIDAVRRSGMRRCLVRSDHGAGDHIRDHEERRGCKNVAGFVHVGVARVFPQPSAALERRYISMHVYQRFETWQRTIGNRAITCNRRISKAPLWAGEGRLFPAMRALSSRGAGAEGLRVPVAPRRNGNVYQRDRGNPSWQILPTLRRSALTVRRGWI